MYQEEFKNMLEFLMEYDYDFRLSSYINPVSNEVEFGVKIIAPNKKPATSTMEISEKLYLELQDWL